MIAPDVKDRKCRRQLTEVEAKRFLEEEESGIPVIETRLARSRAESIAISRELGFPVAMKVVSPDVVHKSDVGGVKLNLQNGTQVGRAYKEILSKTAETCPGARIQGVSVQKMARPGVEVIIGMSKDRQFGQVLMFGLGGVLVEVLKDVSFRVVPVEGRDAQEMLCEIKGYPLLQGYRGQEPVDIQFLTDLIVKVSMFVEKHTEIEELDLNPVLAYKNGGLVVDARITIRQEGAECSGSILGGAENC